MSEDFPLGLVDMTNEQYHSAPGISKSHLDYIAGKSPAHYWHKYLNPNREPTLPTAAQQIGTAIHTAILEPELLDGSVVRGLDVDRRSNANKEAWAIFEHENAGKIILKAEDFDHVLRVRDAVHGHPVAAGLLTGGKAEQTYFAKDEATGELIKCRLDYFREDEGLIIDVKSTEDASPHGFAKSAANYRYDVQVAWYYRVLETLYGWTPEAWVFLAFEKEPPYAIGVYFAQDHDIDRAREAADRDFQRIVEAKRSGAFPDYGVTPMPLELPGWVRR